MNPGTARWRVSYSGCYYGGRGRGPVQDLVALPILLAQILVARGGGGSEAV